MKKKKESLERDKALRERELSDIRFIIKSPQGRRFYWRTMGVTKMFAESYIPGDEGYGTTFNVGRQSVGQWLLKELLEAKPDAFIQMQNESLSESKSINNEKEDEALSRDILKLGE